MATPHKTPKKDDKQQGGPEGMSIWMQLAIAVFVFLALSAGYSAVREYITQQDETIPLSQIVGTFRFYDGHGNRVGNLSVVGKDEAGKNSGLLVLIDLKGVVGNTVKDAQKALLH
jgi:hypothetical protein